MTQFPRILLAGSSGQGDLAEEAVADALVAGLRDRLPDARLKLVTGDEEEIRTRLQVETVPASDWALVAEAMRAADLVVLGGGTLAFGPGDFDPQSVLGPDASSPARLLGSSLLAALLQRPFALAGVGVGPIEEPEVRAAVAGVVTLATHLTVRDRASADLLAALGTPPERVEVAADPAFSLRPCSSQRTDAILTAARLEGHRDRVVAVVPAAWPHAAGWEPRVAAALTDFLIATDAHLLLVPFRRGADEALLERWRASFPAGRATVLPFGHRAAEVAGVLGRCGLVVTMRPHGAILAALGGTPTLVVTPAQDGPPPLPGLGSAALTLGWDDLGASPEVLTRAWSHRDELRSQVAPAVAALAPGAARVVDRLVATLSTPPIPAERHRLASLLAPAVTGLLKRAMVAGVERERVRREGEDRLARHHLSLAGQIGDRDRIIRELQAELFSKVGERDRLIRGLQEELTTKIEERDRIILDLQAALAAAAAGVTPDRSTEKDGQ
jgi:polysaccharide pyruvyl transferase WcaK-like protein